MKIRRLALLAVALPAVCQAQESATATQWTANELDLNNWLTLSVALLALFAAFWQGYVARDHNRRSVTPQLRFDVYAAPDENIFMNLKNSGAGHALVSSISIGVRGDTLQPISKKTLSDTTKSLNIGEPYYFLLPRPGDFFSPGESLSVVKLQSAFPDAKTTELTKKLQCLHVRIEYRSIYGKSFNCETPATWDA
jgi:hypothetical protein